MSRGILDQILSYLTPQTISLQNTAMKNGYCYLTKIGAIVTLSSTGDLKSLTKNTWVTYVTVPEGWRPKNEVYLATCNRSGLTNYPLHIRIDTAGKILFYTSASTNITSAQNCAITGSWSII